MHAGDVIDVANLAEDLLQALTTGLLVGCIYALMCVGLGLIFGIMRVINFAQGEFLMIGMYLTLYLLAAWKLAPALAAGNTVVWKPSEFASASALEFVRLVEQAGFPPGVVNVVTGFGVDVGEPLVTHPKVAKIAFTGGEHAGQRVYELAASRNTSGC